MRRAAVMRSAWRRYPENPVPEGGDRVRAGHQAGVTPVSSAGFEPGWALYGMLSGVAAWLAGLRGEIVGAGRCSCELYSK